MNQRYLILLLFFASLSLAFSEAWAHQNPNQPRLRQMVKKANLIFHGTVTNIEYRSSTARKSKLHDALPHTFVTFKINKILKGKSRSNLVTLRFLGGRGKQAQFLMPSNFPLFDLRDQDVLFVEGNTVRSCPLHQCAAGRFRAIKGMMYDDVGRGILLTKKNQIALGRFNSLADVLTHNVSQTVLKKVVVVPKGEVKTPPDKDVGTHLRLPAFMSHVQKLVRQMFTLDELAKLPPIKNADPKRAFTVRTPIPRKAPAEKQGPTSKDLQEIAGQMGPSEQRERQLYIENGQNPVISNQ